MNEKKLGRGIACEEHLWGTIELLVDLGAGGVWHASYYSHIVVKWCRERFSEPQRPAALPGSASNAGSIHTKPYRVAAANANCAYCGCQSLYTYPRPNAYSYAQSITFLELYYVQQ
jgi:hypothetical protein